jgi:hypothetical protein
MVEARGARHGVCPPTQSRTAQHREQLKLELDYLPRLSLLVVDQREDPLDVLGTPPEHRGHLACIDTLVAPTEETTLERAQ